MKHLLFLIPALALADSVTLAWDPNLEPVSGYLVYKSQTPGVYAAPIGETTDVVAAVNDLTPGQTYNFVVTAFDDTFSPRAVSGYSNEVVYTVPVVPGAPTPPTMTDMHFENGDLVFNISGGKKGELWILQSSKDLKTWEDVQTIVFDVDNEIIEVTIDYSVSGVPKKQFFRLVYTATSVVTDAMKAPPRRKR